MKQKINIHEYIKAISTILDNPIQVELDWGQTSQEVEISNGNMLLIYEIKGNCYATSDYIQTTFGDPQTYGDVKKEIDINVTVATDEHGELELSFTQKIHLNSLAERMTEII